MGITRINHFEAKPGSGEALHALLESVVSIIRNCAGCNSVQLLRGVEDPTRLAIIEHWDSIEAHQKAAHAIPPDTMMEAMASFAKPASGAYYTP